MSHSSSSSSSSRGTPRVRVVTSVSPKPKVIEQCRFGGKCTKDDCTREHGSFGSEADRQLFEVMRKIGISATIEQTISLRRKQVSHAKKIETKKLEKARKTSDQSSPSSDDESS